MKLSQEGKLHLKTEGAHEEVERYKQQRKGKRRGRHRARRR